jgi:hypothetical protein
MKRRRTEVHQIKLPVGVLQAVFPRVRILSATYGPSHGSRLLNGELAPPQESAKILPYTRDVVPIIRALLVALQQQSEDSGKDYHDDDNNENYRLKSCNEQDDLNPAAKELHSKTVCEAENNFSNAQAQIEEKRAQRKTVSAIPLLYGKSMNIVFGDPCPGTTKQLHITYIFEDDIDEERGAECQIQLPANYSGDADVFLGRDKICRTSFSEHERVVLRRNPLQFGQRVLHKVISTKRQPVEGARDITAMQSSNSKSRGSCLRFPNEDHSSDTHAAPTRNSGEHAGGAELEKDALPMLKCTSQLRSQIIVYLSALGTSALQKDESESDAESKSLCKLPVESTLMCSNHESRRLDKSMAEHSTPNCSRKGSRAQSQKDT